LNTKGNERGKEESQEEEENYILATE